MFSEKPLIYLITDGQLSAENFPEKSAQIVDLIQTAAQNEISLIQIREKKLPARLVFELVEKVVKITRGTKTKILVNDRADLAVAARADGVHLTSQSLPTQVIRKTFSVDFIVGVSAHSIEEAEAAKNQGADFVTFSPIFASPGKAFIKGLKALGKVCEKLKPFPVIALGGIDETNFKSVLETGASGFAAIRFLNDTENLRKLKPNRDDEK